VKYIFDTDGGGDDVWALALLLANVNKSDVLGITTVFGNTDVFQATKNMCKALSFLGYDEIPVFQGMNAPLSPFRPFGDDAYGSEGIGKAYLPNTDKVHERENAISWLEKTIENCDEPLTIFCLGPATNIATVLKNKPNIFKPNVRIVAMSGAVLPLGKDSMPVHSECGKVRRGNITLSAEFNAFQDPLSMSMLVRPDIDLTIVPMDSAHRLVMDQNTISEFVTTSPYISKILVDMLAYSKELDMKKFDVDGGFLYDPHAVLWALRPDLYDDRQSTYPYYYCHGSEKTLNESEHGSLSIGLLNTHGQAYILPAIKNLKGVLNFVKSTLSSYEIAIKPRYSEPNSMHLPK
jgi:inosine-uridine nucleoside N-ribohydrolase